MSPEDRLHLLALAAIDGIGPVLARNLIAYCGTPMAVFHTPPRQLAQIPDIGEKRAELLKKVNLVRAEKELAFAEKTGLRVLAYTDAGYPRYLTTEASLPLVLYAKGTLDFNAQPAIAVVGTRKPSEYGKRQARTFAEAFARAGINVVSGLAYGIDVAAHQATLGVGGSTTAVLGHGLDRIYPPENHRTADQIVANGGALLTEFPSGTRPSAKNFPARNRIIAGLSQATLVVEAAETGGALITGRMAFDLNREVYAIPGSLDQPSFAGCNQLIQRNVAKLITKPEEVLADLDLEAAPQPPEAIAKTLSAQEHAIWQRLDVPEGKALDALAYEMNLPVSELVAQLLELEFRGVVQQLPGRRFVQAR